MKHCKARKHPDVLPLILSLAHPSCALQVAEEQQGRSSSSLVVVTALEGWMGGKVCRKRQSLSLDGLM